MKKVYPCNDKFGDAEHHLLQSIPLRLLSEIEDDVSLEWPIHRGSFCFRWIPLSHPYHNLKEIKRMSVYLTTNLKFEF